MTTNKKASENQKKKKEEEDRECTSLTTNGQKHNRNNSLEAPKMKLITESQGEVMLMKVINTSLLPHKFSGDGWCAAPC